MRSLLITRLHGRRGSTDWVVGERRDTYQEGYMPWVVKGPPTVEEYLEAVG